MLAHRTVILSFFVSVFDAEKRPKRTSSAFRIKLELLFTLNLCKSYLISFLSEGFCELALNKGMIYVV